VQVTLRGLASGKTTFVPYSENDLQTTLLDFLRDKGITIASSCGGEGVCKKCAIQNDWLTCKLTLEIFLKRQPDGQILVSYL
jgi:hypothetical protein